jgi:hypothetical protein
MSDTRKSPYRNEVVMRKVYRFGQLSKGERELLETILMEEVEVQAWYAVTYSVIMSEEVFICVQ